MRCLLSAKENSKSFYVNASASNYGNARGRGYVHTEFVGEFKWGLNKKAVVCRTVRFPG